MVRVFLLLIVGTALTGCAGHQMREAKEAFATAKAACKAQWPEVTRDTAVPYERCVGDAEEATILPASTDFSDLVEQRIAFRNALAAKVASGEILLSDAPLRFAQFNTELSNMAHNRSAQMAAEQSERAQAAVSALQASAAIVSALQPAPRPAPVIYVPQAPVHTNCMNFGNMTDCTSQ